MRRGAVAARRRYGFKSTIIRSFPQMFLGRLAGTLACRGTKRKRESVLSDRLPQPLDFLIASMAANPPAASPPPAFRGLVHDGSVLSLGGLRDASLVRS